MQIRVSLRTSRRFVAGAVSPLPRRLPRRHVAVPRSRIVILLPALKHLRHGLPDVDVLRVLSVEIHADIVPTAEPQARVRPARVRDGDPRLRAADLRGPALLLTREI